MTTRRDQRNIAPTGPARRPTASTSGRAPGDLDVVHSPGGDDPLLERSPDPARVSGEIVAGQWGGKPSKNPHDR